MPMFVFSFIRVIVIGSIFPASSFRSWIFLLFLNHSSFSLQVCELDIIFNFEKAYFILDELLIAGEMQDTSKKSVLKAIAAQDMLQEVCMKTSLSRVDSPGL